MDVSQVLARPATVVESGPAAGVVGAAHLGARAGYENLITFDMGGTTAKASLIEAGNLRITSEFEVGSSLSAHGLNLAGGGYAMKVPVVDISEVGAGGGSIISVDRGGSLHVGPRSAGATPGPACYDLGGTEATITDANVVLGYLNPAFLAGGSVPLCEPRPAAAVGLAGAVGEYQAAFPPISRDPAGKFQVLFKLIISPAGRCPHHGSATPACRFDEIPYAQGYSHHTGALTPTIISSPTGR